MTDRNNFWNKLVAVLSGRNEIVPPEASDEAKYSYRNYRGEDVRVTGPRMEDDVLVDDHAPAGIHTVPHLEYCRTF